MISARSHLLPLNGNKGLLILMVFFTWMGCSARTIPIRTLSTTSEAILDTLPAPGRVDTAQWQILDPFDKGQPEVAEEVPVDTLPLVEKMHYRIACLFPLYSAIDPESNENLLRMAHFSMGARLASTDIRGSKKQYTVDVLDVEKYKNRLEKWVKGDSLSDYDVILGPYKTEDIRILTQALKDNDTWIFSPWNTNASLLNDNPNLVQLRPGIEAHLESIATDIAQNYPGAKTYVVCGNKDSREKGYYTFLKNTQPFVSDRLMQNRLELLLADGQTGSLDSLRLKTAYSEESHNVYVLPYWANHNFVLKFLQNMGPFIAEKSNVTIYGLSQWLSFPQLSMDYYERFNIRLCVHGYYNMFTSQELLFKRRFFETYSTIPLEDAYHGYEVMTLLFTILEKNLLEHTVLLQQQPLSPFLYPYQFRTPSPTDNAAPSDNRLHGIENRSTYIVQLQNDRFVRVSSHE
jgi:hypothetical protein